MRTNKGQTAHTTAKRQLGLGETNMDHELMHFAALFTEDQKTEIDGDDRFFGRRHPTWTPLFGDLPSLRAPHYRLNQSIPLISETSEGSQWLRAKVRHLLDDKDIHNATAAMAEIRAYGGLLEAGFDVNPVQVTDAPTPEFHATLDGQALVVEVAAKHQDGQQDELEQGIHDAIKGDGPFPEGVEHRRYRGKNATIDMVISVHQPGGAPDPNKPDDTVQTSLISKVSSIKANEAQLPDDLPSILIVDFGDFGYAPFEGLVEQASPIIRGHNGFTSGAIWNAMYGWCGAPVFEEQRGTLARMRHDGRFGDSRDPKSKLSGVLFVLPEDVVLLENPRANHRLPGDVRLSLCTYPWFDIGRSVLDWENGDAERQLQLQRKMIATLEAGFETLRWR